LKAQIADLEALLKKHKKDWNAYMSVQLDTQLDENLGQVSTAISSLAALRSTSHRSIDSHVGYKECYAATRITSASQTSLPFLIEIF
jgi:hypothetical protein